MKCSKLLSTKQFVREFHYSRLWFGYSDWRALVYIPWLPYKWQFQWIHIVWRWLMVCYFVAWLVVSLTTRSEGGPKWPIYLTNWSFVAFIIYLIMAALSVTVKFFSVHCCKKPKPSTERASDYKFAKPKGCLGSNKLSWYQMIHWFCFTVGGEAAPMILVLYWAVLYDAGHNVDGVSANTHLVNGLVSLIDIFFTGIPISLLHFVYPTTFGAAYTVFTGIYFGANGTDPSGQPYIYDTLDYGGSPATAAAYAILISLLFVPLMHLIMYCFYLIRFWLVYALFGRNKVPCYGSNKLDAEMKEEDELTAV